jgi:hypothetical protein
LSLGPLVPLRGQMEILDSLMFGWEGERLFGTSALLVCMGEGAGSLLEEYGINYGVWMADFGERRGIAMLRLFTARFIPLRERSSRQHAEPGSACMYLHSVGMEGCTSATLRSRSASLGAPTRCAFPTPCCAPNRSELAAYSPTVLPTQHCSQHGYLLAYQERNTLTLRKIRI